MPAARYPTLTDQRAYWDRRWQKTTTPNDWSLKRGHTILSLLRSLPLNNPRILDLGCGTGWFTGQLSYFGHAIGIDLSEAAIAVARSRYPNVEFRTANLLDMDLPAEHFDVVVSQEVIAHVEDQIAYLDRAAYVLKPRGHLIITTANKLVIERVDWPPQSFGHIEQWLDMKGLKRLLKPRFRVLRTTSILPMGHRGILRLVNSHKLNATLRLVIPEGTLENLKERAGLGYTLIAVAQKRS